MTEFARSLEERLHEAIAAAVGDRFPETRQWDRDEVARHAIGRYRRDGGGLMERADEETYAGWAERIAAGSPVVRAAEVAPEAQRAMNVIERSPDGD